MIKYGVEFISGKIEETLLILYKSQEKAREAAEIMAADRRQGEIVTLFSVLCDQEGKPATNEWSVHQIWCD